MFNYLKGYYTIHIAALNLWSNEHILVDFLKFWKCPKFSAEFWGIFVLYQSFIIDWGGIYVKNSYSVKISKSTKT